MKKMQGLTKVSRRAMAAVLALVLALIFSSCENMSDNGPASFLLPLVQTTQTAGQASSQKATIIVRGTVGVGGALPDEVSAKVSALNASIAAQGVSKSAQPELKIGKAEGDDYYYYVTATQQDGERKIVSYGRDDNGAGGAFVGGTNGVSYALPLTEGQWIIECGIKNLENKPVLRATSGLINLTPTDSIVTQDFVATPVNDAGPGSVFLTVNKGVATTIDRATARYKASDGTYQSVNLVKANTIVTGYSDDVLALYFESIDAGHYDMTISFYNAAGVMLFQTVQTVSVFSGMKTNSWVSNGDMDGATGTGLIIDDGFIISEAAINTFLSSVFYVGNTKTKISGARDPSPDNEGTAYAPFASLQQAFDSIAANGSSANKKDYTIFVCGTVTGGVTAVGGMDGKANSIMIQNFDGASAVIEGGKTNLSDSTPLNVLAVETAVPIKIKGVKIINNKTYSRGIILTAENSSVTLLEGTEISGHDCSYDANAYGGGVYMYGANAKLCMKGGVIKNCQAGQGGAVYNKGTFEISGGAYIPYGVEDGGATVKGPGKNDVCLEYDSTNELYKCVTVAGPLNPPAEAGSDKTIATINASGWNRGKQVLAAAAGIDLRQYAGADKKFFAFTDSDAYTTCKASAPTVAKLQAPLYVSPTGLSGNTGSKDSPYDSIATALGHFNDTEEECVINIDGEVIVTETTNTLSSTNVHCSKLVIQGANGLYQADTVVEGKTIAKGTPKDALNGNKTGNISVLYISAAVPVVIRNLKIFGGTGFVAGGYTMGGGICQSNANVTLDSGTLIGDVLNPSAAATSEDDCGNKAQFGGGVCVSGGTLTVKSGAVISHNYATTTSYARGGGICVDTNGKLFIEDGAKIIGNASAKDGGAVYSEGQVTMTGGEISQNKADSNGGAVYNNGTFEMSGKTYIPWGVKDGGATVKGAGKNDVFLKYNSTSNVYKAITIGGPLEYKSGDGNATITPEGWHRGKAVAEGKDGAELPDNIITNRLKFAADAGDSWESILTSDKKEARMFAPIYVAADAAYNATTNPGGYRVCGSKGLDTNVGTKSAPYATVTHALADLAETNSYGKSYTYTVNIDGKVTENLTINSKSGGNVSGVSQIILKGATTDSTALDNLDGGSASKTFAQANRTLTLQGSIPVTVQYLKISGGKINASGGGILIDDDATLNLSVKSLVTENYATGEGAGVYVGGTLNVSNDARVKGNKTRNYSTDADTGDCNVYLPHGKVMNVTGSLYNGYDDAEIHVTTQDEPSITGSGSTATVNTVAITSGYKDKMSGFYPWKYFIGDKYGALLYSNEAALGVNGGSISPEQPYSNMSLTIDKTYVKKSKLSTSDAWFKISGYVSGNPANFSNATSDYYVDLSLKLLYHGQEVPTSYYTVASNKYQTQLKTGLPAGDYVLFGEGVHKGSTYTVSYDIKVVDDSAVPSDCVLTGGRIVTGAVGGTSNPSSVFIENRKVPIPVLIACKYEVTQKEYETYCCYGSSKPSAAYGKGDDFPVYYVTWYDALVYCNLRSIAEGLTPVYSIGGKTNPKQWTGIVAGTGDDLGKYHGPTSNNTTWNNVAFDQSADGWRLPTEAEWEYLARNENKSNYIYSGSDTLADVAWYYGNSASHVTHQKGNNKTANGLGLLNMSGNVHELCWDWKASISADTPATGPSSATGKVIRGGSACDSGDASGDRCKVSDRYYSQSPNVSSYDIGFRVVRTPR